MSLFVFCFVPNMNVLPSLQVPCVATTLEDTDMELQRLEELEKRLAQRYGMAEGTDSEAVLKAATKRAEAPWGRFRNAFLDLLRKANLLSSSGNDVEALRKLRDIRNQLQPDSRPVLASLVSVYT